MTTQTTLITGSSSGIGYYLAHEFALRKHPLILVAPVEAELQAVAHELSSRYGGSVRIIARDLEQPDSADEIFAELQRDGISVDILVNNAGQGFRGRSWEIPIDRDLAMVRLNIEAVLRLTKLFLPPMLARGRGRILNTASVAGFEPGPMLAVYHATKAFVLSWSEALAIELEDRPISVTALCPGPTDTDFFRKAGMVATRAFQTAHVMAPQDVAHEGYEALMREDLFVVPGAMNKALVAASRVLSQGAQAKLNEKFYEEIPATKVTRTPGEIEMAAGGK